MGQQNESLLKSFKLKLLKFVFSKSIAYESASLEFCYLLKI